MKVADNNTILFMPNEARVREETFIAISDIIDMARIETEPYRLH